MVIVFNDLKTPEQYEEGTGAWVDIVAGAKHMLRKGSEVAGSKVLHGLQTHVKAKEADGSVGSKEYDHCYSEVVDYFFHGL